MDLYRYFHPHHNPRLRNTPLRLQELAELEQAALEFKRAIERAELRTGDRPVGGIQAEHFFEIAQAMNYVTESLTMLTSAHPGDEPHDMWQILKERQTAPGWENWCRLLRQRLNIVGEHLFGEESTAKRLASK